MRTNVIVFDKTSHQLNCIEFYMYHSPPREKYKEFETKHITKWRNTLYISDEQGILKD